MKKIALIIGGLVAMAIAIGFTGFGVKGSFGKRLRGKTLPWESSTDNFRYGEGVSAFAATELDIERLITGSLEGRVVHDIIRKLRDNPDPNSPLRLMLRELAEMESKPGVSNYTGVDVGVGGRWLPKDV